MSDFLVEITAKLAVIFIPVKSVKRRIRDRIKTFLYGYKIVTRAKEIGKNFICLGRSHCTKNTIIKDNVRINGLKVDGFGNLIIGNYCQFGQDVRILTSNHDYDNGTTIPYSTDNIIKNVEIGDFSWIGTGVMILPGTKIGEGAIIQAGAVVHGEVPRCAIVGGNPAQVFKYRNIEQFDRLKEEKKFINYYD